MPRRARRRAAIRRPSTRHRRRGARSTARFRTRIAPPPVPDFPLAPREAPTHARQRLSASSRPPQQGRRRRSRPAARGATRSGSRCRRSWPRYCPRSNPLRRPARFAGWRRARRVPTCRRPAGGGATARCSSRRPARSVVRRPNRPNPSARRAFPCRQNSSDRRPRPAPAKRRPSPASRRSARRRAATPWISAKFHSRAGRRGRSRAPPRDSRRRQAALENRARPPPCRRSPCRRVKSRPSCRR